MGLRVAAKEEHIVEQISAGIRSGELGPGDRILSVKALQERYGVSQPVVLRAITRLREAGLLRVVNRDGIFVTEEAALLLTKTFGVVSLSPLPASLSTVPLRNHSPFTATTRKKQPRPMSLYLLDLDSRHPDPWLQLLVDAKEALGISELEVLSADDGHVSDLLASRSIDVIQTVPHVVEEIGTDRFLRFSDYDLLGLSLDDLHEPVRKAVMSGDGLPYVPFSLTLFLLFANTQLMALHGMNEPPLTSVTDFYNYIRHEEGKLKNSSCHCLELGQTFTDALFLSGALHWNGRTLDFQRSKAAAVLNSLSGLQIAVGQREDPAESFLDKKLIFLQHCSFSMNYFASTAPFPWQAYPLPCDPGGSHFCDLTVFAINRNTTHLHAAMEFVRFCVSASVQQRYGQMHVNLPVRASVTASADYRSTSPVPMAILDQQLLAQNDYIPFSVWQKISGALPPPRELQMLLSGTKKPEEILERLEFYLKTIC